MSKQSFELEWARDVLAVYKCQGKGLPKSASVARKALFDWVLEEGNDTELFTKLVPKAIEIMGKYDKHTEEQAVVVKERKSIAELKAILSEAVKEAVA